MRSITSGERALLGGSALNVHVTVEVTDGDGSWVDLTDLLGADWLVSVTWGADIDSPTISGSFTFKRDAQDGTPASLSPFMAGSPVNVATSGYAPLLNAGRRVRIKTAVTAQGDAPAGGDWKEMLVGKIDAVGVADALGVCTFRDVGAFLLDTQIQDELPYGTEGALTPVQDVMQLVLDTTMGTGAYTLSVPVDPELEIGPYLQPKVKVLEALGNLALLRGWSVRYVFGGTPGGVLTLSGVDREPADVADTLGPTEYIRLTKLEVSDADVRNQGRCWYQTLEGAVASATSSDSGSIAEFGVRFIEIGAPSSTGITTLEGAQAMIDYAIADLRDPKADHEIELLYWWPVELADYYEYSPNGVHYDEAQRFAVVSYRHTIEKGSGRTTIQARGTPAGAYRTWLLTRNGLFDGQLTTGPTPLVGPLLGEYHAFDDDPARDGMAWLSLRFTAATDKVLVYAFEAAAAGVPVPELAENRLAWTVHRHEGDVAGAPEWATVVPIATRSGYYRKVLVLPLSAANVRGPTTVLEVQAADVGTGPSGPPTGLAINVQGTTHVVTFTADDADAYHIVWRNGIPVAVLQPGVAAYQEADLQADVPYTWDVCAWRSGQSSAFAGNATPAPPTEDPTAPAWQSGYPAGFGYNSIYLGWTGDAATTAITVEQQWPNGVWTTLVQFDLTDPTHCPTGIYVDDSQPPGTERPLRIRANFDSAPSLYSATVTGRWGAPLQPQLTVPTWDQGAPTYTTISFGLRSLFYAWREPNADCTKLEVWTASGLSTTPPTAGWSVAYTTTSPSVIAAGSHTGTTASSGVIWARLKATFPTGVAFSDTRKIVSA